MLFLITRGEGEFAELPRTLSAWNVRTWASSVQFNNRVCPDNIMDIHIDLAISILESKGYAVEPVDHLPKWQRYSLPR